MGGVRAMRVRRRDMSTDCSGHTQETATKPITPLTTVTGSLVAQAVDAINSKPGSRRASEQVMLNQGRVATNLYWVVLRAMREVLNKLSARKCAMWPASLG